MLFFCLSLLILTVSGSSSSTCDENLAHSFIQNIFTEWWLYVNAVRNDVNNPNVGTTNNAINGLTAFISSNTGTTLLAEGAAFWEKYVDLDNIIYRAGGPNVFTAQNYTNEDIGYAHYIYTAQPGVAYFPEATTCSLQDNNGESAWKCYTPLYKKEQKGTTTTSTNMILARTYWSQTSTGIGSNTVCSYVIYDASFLNIALGKLTN
jgi:hypothetical protein